MDRRRSGPPDQSPMDTLQQLPPVIVLERIPVPLLAVVQDGTILFANSAFAEMLGRTAQQVLSFRFDEIFHRVPAGEPVLSVVSSFANMVVELVHSDGSVVRALMSKSALRRTDDQIALAAFQDLTERLWIDEQ